jgi:hypothetical protein
LLSAHVTVTEIVFMLALGESLVIVVVRTKFTLPMLTVTADAGKNVVVAFR